VTWVQKVVRGAVGRRSSSLARINVGDGDADHQVSGDVLRVFFLAACRCSEARFKLNSFPFNSHQNQHAAETGRLVFDC